MKFQSSVNFEPTMVSSIWDRCLIYIKDVVEEQDYKQYFANTKAVNLQGEQLLVEAFNKHSYDYLRSEKARELVLRALRSEQSYLTVEYLLPSADSVWQRCLTFIKDNLDPEPYENGFYQFKLIVLMSRN